MTKIELVLESVLMEGWDLEHATVSHICQRVKTSLASSKDIEVFLNALLNLVCIVSQRSMCPAFSHE